MRTLLLLAFMALLAGRGLAQGHVGAAANPNDRRTLPERAAARFPQPVQVGALTGRLFLEPSMHQSVLGRVAGAARDQAGAVHILVDRGGVLGLGTRRVAVPIEATALLGQFLVLLDIGEPAFAALPEAPPSLTVLPPDTTIRVGLTKN